MPLHRGNAERSLNLLWELLSASKDAKSRDAYVKAISSLHVYLSDILPASQPCLRAKVKGGVVEIHPRKDTPVCLVNLEVAPGDKLGVVLDSINVDGVSSTVSAIVVSLVTMGSVAARDGKLRRGDQLLEINGHSLTQATLERARWLLESAARSGAVTLVTVPSGLLEGIKHSKSRENLLDIQETPKHKRSRSLDNRIKRGKLVATAEVHHDVKRSKTDVATRLRPDIHTSQSSLHLNPRYAPSIGSRQSSSRSISSTVEVAAYLARSSMRSTSVAGFGNFKKRKVRKMHIMKGNSGLGIRIVGGKGSKHGDMGVFVSQLEEGGAANKDSRLKPGDELLMVDGKSLVGLTHTEAVEVLKSTQRLVQLVIATEDDGGSLASSLQSIPDKIRLNRTSREIMPDLLSSPNRNAFEMKPMRVDDSVKEDAVEASPLIQTSEHFQMIRTVTPWGRANKMPPQATHPLEPLIKTIVYVKTAGKSLGFSICGGLGSRHGDIGIMVRNIDQNGLAAQDGRLKKRDEVLEVNSKPLLGCTHKEAAKIIRGLKSEVITLVVRSGPNKIVKRSSSVRGTDIDVELDKLPRQPLGIQLAEVCKQSNEYAVFIKNIAPQSIAHTSGKLHRYDQIVKVNESSVLDMRAKNVRTLLSTAPPGILKVGVVRPKDSVAVATIIEEQEAKMNRLGAGGVISEEVTDTQSSLTVEELFVPEDNSEGEEERLSETEVEDDDFINNPVPSPDSPPASDLPHPTTSLTMADPLNTLTTLEIRDSHLTSDSPTSQVNKEQEIEVKPSPDTRAIRPLVSDTSTPLGFAQLKFTFKKRARSGLGVTVVASSGSTKDFFMIRRLIAGGIAAKDGRIQPGDRLVSVNDKSLQGLTHAAVLQAITDAPKDCQLVVWRDPEYTLDSTISVQSFPSRSGSYTSLVSNDDELKKGEGKRCLSTISQDNSPLAILRRLSQGRSSPTSKVAPNTSRFSLTAVAMTESPLSVKRWSTGEVLAGQEGQSSLDIYFPLLPPPEGRQDKDTHKSVAPVPSLPSTLPQPDANLPSPPSTPLSSPPGTPPTSPSTPLQSPPGTPPSQPDTPLPSPPGTPPPSQPLPSPPGTPPSQPDTPLPSLPGTPPPSLPGTPPSPPGTPPAPLVPLSTMPPNIPGLTVETVGPPCQDDSTRQSSNSPSPGLAPRAVKTGQSDSMRDDRLSGSAPTVINEEAVVATSQTQWPPELSVSSPPLEENEEEDEQPPLPPTAPPSIGRPEDSHSNQWQPRTQTSIESGPTMTAGSREAVLSQTVSEPLDIPKGKRQEAGPFEIEVSKSRFGMGIQLVSDAMGMLAIKKMTSWSGIANNGNIRVGDQILSVNDESFIGKSIAECDKILKALPKGQVRFVAMAPPRNVTGSGLHATQEEKKAPARSEPSPPQRQPVQEEGVVHVQLECHGGKCLGLEIEGGIDTPLQYVYIQRLVPGLPANECGAFRNGDQLVMVGEECVIGLTNQEADRVVKNASGSFEVVVQRKASPKQTHKMSIPEIAIVPVSETNPDETSETMNSADSASHLLQLDITVSKETLPSLKSVKASSNELKSSQEEVRRLVDVPEEMLTIDLHRSLNEKFGLGITGGCDNPRLQEVHVKIVRSDDVADRDGRLKRGDRIVSVNGQNLSGVSNKTALSILKEAGQDMTLVVARKVGRHTSTMNTPLASTHQSRKSSGEQSQQESRTESKQTSPVPPRRRRISSGENSQVGSKNSSPRSSTYKHRRRESLGAGGEVLAFKGEPKTLPRQLGSTVGAKLVEIQKGPTGIGILLQGGREGTDTPVVVKSVFPGGAAYKSGKIRNGDVILEVNGVSFEHLSHDEAVAKMKSFPQGKIILIIRDKMAAIVH